MSRLTKVKTLSFDELRVRGAQSVHASLERRGWSTLAQLPDENRFRNLLSFDVQSEADLLDHFRTRHRPQFFAGLTDKQNTVETMLSVFPSRAEQICERAHRVLNGKFDLLGLRGISFGDPPDWQLEPLSGKRSPLEHWSRLNYLDPAVIGDKKIVWELNRHQYFVTLGQAYWLSGDERYANCFAEHLQSWMDQNSPKLGINWASSLEVAFRSISWLWAFEFFKHSKYLNASLFARALKFLFLQARHLETYLSTYFSPNTHLTGEALGLFYLGTFLPEFKAASRWQTTGRRILLEQMSKHVQADGVYFEQSSYYHRYTTDFYMHFLILSQRNRLALPGFVEDKLKLLLDHLTYITRPDGTTPLFGDDDGGRLMFPDATLSTDFRSTVATGAALFERNDYKFVAGAAPDELLWLLGPAGVAKFESIHAAEPTAASKAFPEGGYYVMRDGWNSSSNYLLIDCGPHGMNNCGHAHADALSFELAANGRTLLVDPATYTYTGSKSERDWFRGSQAHNTLTVDGQSSSESARPFSWNTIANCRTINWISRNRFDYFQGTHDGYQRLENPVDHARSVLFLKQDYWIMRDAIRAEGQHDYDLWYHLNNGVDFVAEGDPESIKLKDSAGFGLKVIGFGANYTWHKEDGFVSHCYAERTPAVTMAFSGRAEGPHEIVTFMLPRVETSRVREVEAIGGRAFEISGEAAYDVLLVRTGARSEMSRLASDFEWTWARYADEFATIPEQLVLIGGRWLELGGKEVLRSKRPISYLVASRDGEQFRIETDDGVLRLQLPVADLESALRESKS